MYPAMNKLILCFLLFPVLLQAQANWQIIPVQNPPQKREDCTFVEANNLFYLVGGRGIKPVEVFNPKTNGWQVKGNTPVEMHHFQAITYKNEIYMVGGMNGHYPHETTIENVYIYGTKRDEWRKGPALPKDRLRGSGGAAVYNGKIYLICGIRDGHYEGTVSWMDEFDPATGQWRILPDAPHARDHVQATVIGNKLYMAGGRRTSSKTKQGMELTLAEIDIYDFKKGTWETLPGAQNIPTPRAGCTNVSYKGKLVVIGGESIVQKESHNEVEAFNPKTGAWTKLPPMVTGRHDTQAISYKNKIYIAAGSANSGGGPDQNSIEVLK
jgi:N-acetylneuraminic acid mutarotase